MVENIVIELALMVDDGTNNNNGGGGDNSTTERAKDILSRIDDYINESLEKNIGTMDIEKSLTTKGTKESNIPVITDNNNNNDVVSKKVNDDVVISKEQEEEKQKSELLKKIYNVTDDETITMSSLINIGDIENDYNLDIDVDEVDDVVDLNAFATTTTNSSSGLMKINNDDKNDNDDEKLEFISECRYMLGDIGIWFTRTVCLKNGMLWAQPLNSKTVIHIHSLYIHFPSFLSIPLYYFFQTTYFFSPPSYALLFILVVS